LLVNVFLMSVYNEGIGYIVVLSGCTKLLCDTFENVPPAPRDHRI
jgi:hypothetical protein